MDDRGWQMGRWFSLLTVWLLASSLAAQESACAALQNDAWANIAAYCAEQMPTSLCYGHPTVSVVLRQDHQSERGRFSRPGDQIALTGMDWFSTSSEADSWGTARALFDAYPPDNLNVQAAAMVFFGDVAVFLPEPQSIPAPLLDVEVAAQRGAKLRTSPTTSARAIRTASHKTPLKAIGRSQDQRWVQVYADPTTVAWVSGSLLAGDVSGLPVLSSDATEVPLWLPLQSFGFHSGFGDAPCDGLPPSGLLLQTSKDADPLRFEINGARLYLSGAAFLQAQITTGMLVHILDGGAVVEALDGEVEVRSGSVSRVSLDRDEDGALFPIESPSAPIPYDYHSLLDLPIDLLLHPVRIGLDVYSLVSPRPRDGGSPIAGMALDAPCTFTTGQSGAYIRSQPDPKAAIVGVLGYRESAQPLARAIGGDGLPWWKLAENVWIQINATVTGGDCNSVPFIETDE